jgi:hypothetical protein
MICWLLGSLWDCSKSGVCTHVCNVLLPCIDTWMAHVVVSTAYGHKLSMMSNTELKVESCSVKLVLAHKLRQKKQKLCAVDMHYWA